MTLEWVLEGDWPRGENWKEETYKLPRRKIKTIEIFCLLETFRPSTMRTGRAKITVSMTTSTAPVAIQNILKLKQYSGGTIAAQLYFTGLQLMTVAMVAAIQKARTTMPTSRDWMRKDTSIEKIRRYIRRMDTLTAVTQVK